MNIKDKVAVVTGASAGVGRELACEFARQGARVVCAARRESKLMDTVRLIKEEEGDAIYVVTDVTDPKQVENLIQKTLEHYERVDILFNNAGSLGAVGATWELEIDEWWHDVPWQLQVGNRGSSGDLSFGKEPAEF